MRHSPPALMLFAAGFGTRMKHLTALQPKPLVRVAGKALIDHAIDLGRDAETTPIVANLHYLPHMLETHLDGTGVKTIREEPEILETGGGLRHALPMLGPDPVATLNTDAIWAGANPLRLLIDAWDPDRMDALLICIPTAQAHGRSGAGDFGMASAGRLSRGGDLVYGGAQILKTERLHDVAERAFSLNLVWNEMAKNDRLFGLPYDGHWCDVGRPDGIAEAEDMLVKHRV